eukprot:SAG11_NODE_40718_length_199_cov_126.270000_1_plen_29_part_01
MVSRLTCHLNELHPLCTGKIPVLSGESRV